jgi:hypothetical protein
MAWCVVGGGGDAALQNDDDDDPQQHVSDITWVCLLQTYARLSVTQRVHS